MLQFLARRLLVALLVCITVLTFAFALTQLSGDLAISIAGPNSTAADIEIIRKACKLERPVIQQFFDWVSRAVVADFGQSYFFRERVAKLIGDRLPLTLTLGQAMPSFWLGLVLTITFGLHLCWLPISGTGIWQHFVMPGTVLAFSAIPALMRLTRSGMIDAISADYIRTARAEGLSRASIILKRAARNAPPETRRCRDGGAAARCRRSGDRRYCP